MLRALLCLLILPLSAAPPDAPIPQSVAVIFNSKVPESEKLAKAYAAGRGIPAGNLVGFDLPDKEELTRAEFDSLIRLPLIAEFDRRKWWERKPGPNGNLVLARTRIQVLACVRGVPSRVKHPTPKLAEGEKPKPKTPEDWLRSFDASVDSELALLCVEGTTLEGPLRNQYYNQDSPIGRAGLPLLLVGRIDGPSFEVCHRMIRDALIVEQSGLWGMAVVDIANKSRLATATQPADPSGDPWLRTLATALGEAGIPTLVDDFDATLPVNFPLKDTALYFGWYDWHVSGPFKNPNFKFKPGAIAVHLHSFSAATIHNATQNWCAPLLNKGAAATLGNVYEPLLPFTHNFDIFVDRLLKGYTLVEAAYMSHPAVSWQGVVIGDPLYRPFLHLEGTGTKKDEDAAYRALRIAQIRWAANTLEREHQLRAAAKRMNNGLMLEALGHDFVARRQFAQASAVYQEAKALYPDNTDKLRMDLLVIALDRKSKRDAAAIKGLRDAKLRYSMLAESEAAAAWLNILDPPPPPPASPKQ